jgi:hypothetical protein
MEPNIIATTFMSHNMCDNRLGKMLLLIIPRTLKGTEKAQEIELSKSNASDASIRSDG